MYLFMGAVVQSKAAQKLICIMGAVVQSKAA
jgi:hypothetical protein